MRTNSFGRDSSTSGETCSLLPRTDNISESISTLKSKTIGRNSDGIFYDGITISF